MYTSCVISRAFHVLGLSKEVEEMPMGRTKREPVHESYETASGPIPYNMTNDYMFRAILQKNEFVLRGLIGALLHLDQREIVSVEITNPIMPGEQIDNKAFVLDQCCVKQ